MFTQATAEMVMLTKHFFFRPVTRRAGENTQVEVQLVFNENATAPIPSGAEVVSVLKTVAETNNTFQVLFDATEITLISKSINIDI